MSVNKIVYNVKYAKGRKRRKHIKVTNNLGFNPKVCELSNKDENRSKVTLTRPISNGLFVDLFVGTEKISAMIDTGSPVSIIAESLLLRLFPNYRTTFKRYTSPQLTSYTNHSVVCIGNYLVPVEILGFGKCQINFTVTKEDFSTLIGRQELNKFAAKIVFNGNNDFYLVLRKSYKKEFFTASVHSSAVVKGRTLAVLTVKLKFDKTTAKRVSALKEVIVTAPCSDTILPVLASLECISSDSESSIFTTTVKVFNSSQDDLQLQGQQLRIEPIPEKGVQLLKDLSLGDTVDEITENRHRHGYKLQREKISHFNPDLFAVYPGLFDYAEAIGEKINFISESELPDPNIEIDMENLGVGISQPIQWTPERVVEHFKNFPEPEKTELTNIFLANISVISGNVWDMGQVKDKLNIKFDRPIPKERRVYPLNRESTELLRAYVDFLVFYGLAKKAKEEYGCPVFLVKRKSGQSLVRCIFDLRIQNACISEDLSAIMGGVLTEVQTLAQNARYVTSIDLRQCFYALPLHEDVIKSGYSQFLTSFGAFYLTVSTTGGATVPRYLNRYMRENLNKTVDGEYVPLNDVVGWYDDYHIYTPEGGEKADHLCNVRTFIGRLAHLGFKINIDKCIFVRDLKLEDIDILGFKVGYKTIRADPKKIEAVLDMQAPRTLRELQVILGSVNFFKNLIPLKGGHAISILNKKLEDGKLKWDAEAQENFQILKESLGGLVLHAPRGDSVNILFSDSSKFALGAVLFSVPYSRLSISKTHHDWVFRAVTDEALMTSLMEKKLTHFQVLDSDKCFFTLIAKVYNMFMETEESFQYIIRTLCHHITLHVAQYQYSVMEGDRKTFFLDIARAANTGVPALSGNYEGILLQAMASILERQVWIVNEVGSKAPVIKIGSPRPKTPIILYFNIVTDIGNITIKDIALLGSKVPFSGFSQTNVRTGLNLQNEDIVRSFFKILRSPRNEEQADEDKVKVIGYYTKALAKTNLNKSSYEKEALALYSSLCHFSEHLTLNKTICLTDNSPSYHIFCRAGQIKNRKILSINLKILTEFPHVGIVLVQGKKMLGDFLSRIMDKREEQQNVFPVCIDKVDSGDHEVKYFSSFSSYFNFLESLMQKAVIEDSQQIALANNKVNLLRLNLSNAVYEKFLSFEKIMIETLSHVNTHGYGKFIVGGLDGMLVNNDGKIFCPPKLETVLIAKFHSQRGHKTGDRLLNDLKNHYCFFSVMEVKEKIKNFTESCMACKTTKPNTLPTERGIMFTDLSFPGEAISLDFMETENLGTSGEFYAKKFLIVFDHYSHKIFSYFCSSSTEKDTILNLLTHFSNNTVPSIILTDNATNFSSKSFMQVLSLFGIRKVVSSPRRSTARASVEKSIDVLRSHVRLLGSLDNSISFVKYLPIAVHIVNNTPTKQSRFSPNQIYHKNLTSNVNTSFLRQRAFLANEDEKFSLNIQPKSHDLKKSRSTLNRIIRQVVEKERSTRLARQKKLNLTRYKLPCPPGSFAFPKVFPGTTVSNPKMQDKFSRAPHIVLREYPYSVILKNVLTEQVVVRSKSHLKTIKLKRIADLELPQEVADLLDLISLEDFVPIVPDKLPDKKPKPSRTRSETKKAVESDSDDENQGLDFLTPF